MCKFCTIEKLLGWRRLKLQRVKKRQQNWHGKFCSLKRADGLIGKIVERKSTLRQRWISLINWQSNMTSYYFFFRDRKYNLRVSQADQLPRVYDMEQRYH